MFFFDVQKKVDSKHQSFFIAPSKYLSFKIWAAPLLAGLLGFGSLRSWGKKYSKIISKSQSAVHASSITSMHTSPHPLYMFGWYIYLIKIRMRNELLEKLEKTHILSFFNIFSNNFEKSSDTEFVQFFLKNIKLEDQLLLMKFFGRKKYLKNTLFSKNMSIFCQS